jgi:hypothetical protein
MEHISNMAEVVIASILTFLNVANSFHIDADVIQKNTYVRLFVDEVGKM